MRPPAPEGWIQRAVHHVSVVDGVEYPEETLVQHISPGAVQITDTIKLRGSRNLAIARDGGLGDLLMLTPTIKVIGEDFPDLIMDLFVNKPFIQLFENNPYIHEVRALTSYVPLAYDAVVDLNHFVEKSPDSSVVDRVSLFAQAFGIKLQDGSIDYYMTDEERAWGEQWVEDQGLADRRWCPMGIFATDPRRSWPEGHALELGQLLLDAGVVPVYMHNDEALLHANFDGLDEVRYLVGMTTRQKAAVLRLARVVVSTDTGVYHLAAAGRGDAVYPVIVVLFGLIAPHLRTKWYKNMLSLTADCDCVPCNENTYMLPQCHRQCMTELTPELVFQRVMLFMGEVATHDE